ncbi:MAG: carbohydrate ABC transporter permease, partial [Christensenellales bacterium]
GVVQPGNIFLLRIFMQNTPKEIYESARIDGAGEYTILLKMVMPLVKSGIATVTLFFVLGYWGDVVTPRLYIDDRNMFPLPLLLDGLANSIGRPVGSSATGAGVTLTTPMLFAMCIIAAGPMVFIFQFFQKYFVEGLVLGSVKG